MKRGDIVTVAAKGHYSGKPRPAVIVQSDLFTELPSVTLCLLSSEITEAPLFRLTVEPNEQNGLQKPCQIMIDKSVTVPREKLGGIIGTLDGATMLMIDRSLALFLGIAEAPAKRKKTARRPRT